MYNIAFMFMAVVGLAHAGTANDLRIHISGIGSDHNLKVKPVLHLYDRAIAGKFGISKSIENSKYWPRDVESRDMIIDGPIGYLYLLLTRILFFLFEIIYKNMLSGSLVTTIVRIVLNILRWLTGRS